MGKGRAGGVEAQLVLNFISERSVVAAGHEAQETRPGINRLWSILNEHLAGSFLRQTEHRLYRKTKA